MRNTLFGKLKQNKAFTLMEMLLAVALLVVLSAISVVSINSWTKSIKMNELDSYAKTVYLEAQNQMASLKVEGALAQLNKNLNTEGHEYNTNYKDRKLTAMPTDYDESVYGEYYKSLYYFSNLDGTIGTTFIPASSLSTDNGNYLLEVNPATGDIYGVFFWEKTNEALDGKTIPEAYAIIQGIGNRNKSSRSDYEIGYYGGAAVNDVLASEAYQLDQKVEVINGDELYVKLSYEYNSYVINNIDKFDIQISILGESSGVSWEPAFTIEDNYIINGSNGRLETGLLLDGIGANQNFKTITSGSGLIPGENLFITVKTVYQYDSIKLKEQSMTYKVNSLFDSVEGAGAEECTVKIRSIRHLLNLSTERSSDAMNTYLIGAALEKLYVEQTNNIDYEEVVYVFSADNKYVGETAAHLSNPVSSIANTALFENNSIQTHVNGNDYVIKNLKVNGKGLFALAKWVDFSNVRLEDFTLNASGSSDVGALVGQMTGGSLNNCGVYLATYYQDASGAKRYYNQDQNATYGNEMAAHYATMAIKGKANVGGLVGAAFGVTFSDCYAAVQVQGEEQVGGLVGQANDCTVKNSYASGDVYASGNHVGGFAGYATGIEVNDAYAAGDVRGASFIGGFVGTSVRGTYANVSSYGAVLNKNGGSDLTGILAGGFTSVIETNNGDPANIGYLSQVGYNASGLTDEILKKSYSDLAANAASTANLAKTSSYPYDGNLLFKAFPFKMVTDNHYGDWMLQYFINNSLVYYEKYADGYYGYYSVTKLKDATQDGADADDYVWVLDSLRDETCVEDGYALLSMFYLDSVDYTVSQYVNSSWSTVKSGTLKVSANEYGEDKMVRLEQHGILAFNAYAATSGSEFNADYSGQPIMSTFTTNGMYLYQLPYELQNTDRYNVGNFYDRIVFKNGYAAGNLPSEDENAVGGTPVIESEEYYYCPHFAKLAANPGIGRNLSQPSYVAVRSARQLNCLGRVPYYWNKRGGAADVITYTQEVDINFSTYTNGTKKYCGHEYNLLAFDTEYANQPIGEWDGQSGGYGSFQNDYNGNYKKIIDYCVKSDKQYVGLFGEIYKADGATGSQIQNVVMVVSDPDHEANYATVTDPMQQNNAGYIIASFIDTSGASGDDRPRAAVGALVGSDYTIGITDGDASVFTVNNCVSTGYKVQYHINTPTGGQQPLGIAVGGMIGYTRGNIAHSFAGNDVTLVANASITGNNAAVCIGGFAGSAYYGTTLNCYSGGTIDVDDNNHTGYVTRLRVAGFCPGWLDAPGITNTTSSEQVRYQNVYSYTQVTSNVWEVLEDASSGKKFDHLMPVVSRMRLEFREVRVSLLKKEWKWDTDSTNGDTTGVRVPGISFYLTTVLTDDMINKSGAKEYFQDNTTLLEKKPKTCDPATYAQLSNMEWVNENSDTDTHLEKTASYDYPVKATYAVPYSSDLKDESYPFPAFVTDADGNYVHYGDWPLQ